MPAHGPVIIAARHFHHQLDELTLLATIPRSQTDLLVRIMSSLPAHPTEESADCMSNPTCKHSTNEDESGTAHPSRIPDFTSREEEAAWWDSHSIVDYLDELEPVRLKFAKNLSSPIAVRLDASDRAQLTKLASDQGVGTSTLIRMWVKERLKQQAS